MFFSIHVFQGPGFSRSRLFMVKVFQGPGYSGSSLFRVKLIEGPSFSGFRLFRVWIQGPGPGFRSKKVSMNSSSHLRCSIKKAALKNFAISS